MAKNIEITELDVKNIKSNIIEHMKKDSTFKDYDFEASGLNTLIDILAVNTHHNAYYMNMLTNEMFLDSARMRENVVSIVKSLNYTPRSYSCAKMIVSLELIGTTKHSNPDVYETMNINRGLTFAASYQGKVFNFVPEKTKVVEKSASIQNPDGTYSNIFAVDELTLLQGAEVSEEYVVDNTNPNQRFFLTNANADTTTLKVFLQPDPSEDTTIELKLARDNMRLDGNSQVYFLQEGQNGKYEVFFGDGILGMEVESGSIVHTTYLVSQGSEANGIAVATVRENSERDRFRVGNVEVLSPAFGGAEKEGIESIKFNAPRNFEGQKRAVTVRDYKTIIPQIYPTVASVNVWGGEDNIPQQFGKVFVAIRPTNGFFLSDYEKNTIRSILRKEYSVVSILPEIVDPDYTKIKMDVQVKWDNESTVLTEDEIKTMVMRTIKDYSDNYLNEFDSYFRYSNIVRKIDDTDAAVTNNVTHVTMVNEQEAALGSSAPYQFNFNNAIKKGTLKSVGFQVDGSENYWYVEEDETFNGDLNFYAFDATDKKIYAPYIDGTIDYNTGIVKLKDTRINQVFDNLDVLRFEAEPVSMDIVPRRNQILLIDPVDVTITMLADTDDFNTNYDITTQNVTITRR